MGIAGNSRFQKPPKVGVSDIINFQVGGNLLQTSFAKAFQEPDTESVVIANVNQPVQLNETKTSNIKMLKNAEKKRASLNQQIRDIIQQSIKRKKSKDWLSEKEEQKEMFTINHNLPANKQLDREERIQEEEIRRRRLFDQNMKTPSYQSSLDKEAIEKSATKNQKNIEKTRESVESEDFSKVFEEEKTAFQKHETTFPKYETESADEVEFIEEERIDADEEQLESEKGFSQSGFSNPTQSGDRAGVNYQNLSAFPLFTLMDPSSSISSHCIMSLPQDFFELLEKLVGVMIIQQNNSGITEITVTIHNPGSPLNQSEVLLQFFDTNPRSCIVELRGTPEAVHHFHKYHTEFVSALEQSKLSLDIDVRRPSLLPMKRVVKRKRGS